MGDGNLSQEEIDALLGMGDDSGGGDAGGDLDLDSLLGGGDDVVAEPSGGAGLDQSELDALAGFSDPTTGVSDAPQMMATSTSGGGSGNKDNVDLLMDVILNFTVELGRTHMLIKDILHLDEGSIVELEKNVGDEVDILVNDRLFGRGQLIIVDEYFAVKITHVLDPLDRYRLT